MEADGEAGVPVVAAVQEAAPLVPRPAAPQLRAVAGLVAAVTLHNHNNTMQAIDRIDIARC